MGASTNGDAQLRARIIAAALACVARWGVAKTTLEDVAREAGCGRATIYRTFAGGKAEVLRAAAASEAERCLREIETAIGVVDDDLTEIVVAGVVAAARFLAGHEPLAYLLDHEPDVVLPWISFHRLGALFDLVGEFAAPHLRPFVADDEAARRAAEWLARVVLTYVLNPAEGIDLSDPVGARHLLATYVIPGIVRAAPHALQEEPCPARRP